MEVQRLFRLSVWRPAKLIRKLDYILDNNEQSPSLAFEPERLHEQVYAWDPGRIDIFIGLDKNLSGMFRERLVEKFAPHLMPEKRNLALLSEVIEALYSELSKIDFFTWSPSEQTLETGTDEINLRVNAPLALLNHLRWIVKTFENMPGASAVIR